MCCCRRHGAEDADGKDRGRRVLAVRSARDRAPGARHRVQLLAHLHAEPAIGQAARTARTHGTAHTRTYATLPLQIQLRSIQTTRRDYL